MKKQCIRVILQFNNEKSLKEITINSNRVMHEVEIYEILEKLFPSHIKCNWYDINNQDGYSFEYVNGLNSVTIFRS